MAEVPVSFVNGTLWPLWPEFEELDKTLSSYLEEATNGVISEHRSRRNRRQADKRELGADNASKRMVSRRSEFYAWIR